MAQEWYVETGGRVDGPVSARELQARAAAGRLRPNDRVSPDRKKWVTASKIKGLSFADPTPPSAPAATALLPRDDLPGQPATQSTRHTPPTVTDTVNEHIDHIPGYELLGVLGKG